MRMNITYTGFIADVRRVIAVIKISQPIVTAQNFPTTWNPIPPTLHAEHIKKYLFFYCLLCFKSNWCPYNFLRAIHEAWPLRLCVWILSTRFNKSMVSSSHRFREIHWSCPVSRPCACVHRLAGAGDCHPGPISARIHLISRAASHDHRHIPGIPLTGLWWLHGQDKTANKSY